jgi:hypothetical protein
MNYRALCLLIVVSGLGNAPVMALQEWIHLSSKTGDLPAPGPATEQTASLTLDVDKDGVNDFVIGSRLKEQSVLWYRRGEDEWTKFVIEDTNLTIEAGGAFHDPDGDGDIDIVFGSDTRDNKIWWWENPYPNFDPAVPWRRREIKNTGGTKHHDMIFGDFDGDGRDEFVFWNQGARKLFLAEIPADSQVTRPWPYTEIFTSGSQAEGLAKIDIDGDGKLDIVGGGRWFKHDSGAVYTPYVIDEEQEFTRAAAGQLKAGGWPEVVFVAGDEVGPLKWYEWTGTTWVGHDLLGYDVDHGHSLDVADLNGDGNLDIFCAEMRIYGGNPDAKLWIFYGDGNGIFTESVLATGFGNHESRVADLDGDGDLDVLGKPFNWDTPRVDVWLNNGTGQPLDRWQRHVIDIEKPWRSVLITSADINGDSLNDIITGGWWYKNPGKPGDLWTRRNIGLPLRNMATVFDFDGDGDVDVLGTHGIGSTANDSLSWARNDSAGAFTILSNITKGNGDFLQGVAVLRVPLCGPTEIALSWHDNDRGVQMLTVPPNPSIAIWPWRLISPISQDEALSAGDIDRDGDLDLLLGTTWLRNDGWLWSPNTVFNTSDSPDRNRLADINRDGRLDAVVGYEAISKSGKLAWYEQDSVAASLWIEHVIANVIGPMSLDVADMDNDGDWDAVVGEHNLVRPDSAKLYVFENMSRGTKWIRHLVYTGDEHHDGAQVADIDGDGDFDIISIGWSHGRVLLYENKAIDKAIDQSRIAPTILAQPENVTAKAGETAAFRIAATGSLPLSYQWRRDSTDIAGATADSYTTPPTTLADSGATFYCVVTNPYGSATSDTVTLTVISAPPAKRVTSGQIVLYTFDESNGATVFDVSGVGTPLNLNIDKVNAVKWIPGGLAIQSPTIVATTGPATKIIDSCRAANEITIEAWIRPANTAQTGPARIVSLSVDPYQRNFTVGQTATAYEARLRTTTTSTNGFPALPTPSGSAVTQLAHVTYTRDVSGTARFYINGEERANMMVRGKFSNWTNSYRLALANEISNNRPWLGEYHLVAIFNRALGPEEIRQNYEAGPQPQDSASALDEFAGSSLDATIGLPRRLELHPNYPNPFNPTTNMEFSLPERGFVTLKIFTATGNEVAALVSEEFPAGRHKFEWDARGLTSGVYFSRLSVRYVGQNELHTQTRKLLLLK